MPKEKIRNKLFKSVKDKLKFIQKNCNEPELFEDLAYLFKMKGFNNVRITHGSREFGKDLVFSIFDKTFDEEKWYAVIVKNKPATQNHFVHGNEIANQIEQAINHPFLTAKGLKKNISGLFIVINGNVTDQATQMISSFISPIILPNIKILDYQGLREQIEQYSKEAFLDNMEPSLSLFVTNQIERLSDISISNSIFDLKTEDINQIFVNVQTTYSKELKKINRYLTFDKKDKKINEEDIEGSKEILNSKMNFIVHGIPTSGKTLFLKRIGINALKEENTKKIGVFYFELPDYNSKDFNIKKAINNQYESLVKSNDFDENDYSKIVLLFDSLDFVSGNQNRINFLELISSFSGNQENENYQIVLATRDFKYLEDNNYLENFKDTELLPFDFGQALQLVKKIIPNNESKTNNFLKALKNSMLNTSIQRTPLALTMLAILYRDDKVDLKELPANIFALYDRFTDVYLDKWDVSKGITQLYKYEQTKNILAFIAFHLHKMGESSISEDKLSNYLNKLRKDYNYDELNDIPKFIKHLKLQNGIFLYESVNSSFKFFNHYFQEFFASLCIEDEDNQILLDNFLTPWWSNSIVFYCGKNPKSNKIHSEINKTIIPLDSYQKYSYIHQHSKCLQASHSISINNRKEIVQKILFEYDMFFKKLEEEGIENENSIINHIPFIGILTDSRRMFNSVFSSKHITTEETITFFQDILLSDNKLSDITNYNLAYYLTHKLRLVFPFEVFAEKVKDIDVWNRILYVDINFFHLRKKMDKKQYNRIKRRMNNKKFLIQKVMNESILKTIE